VVTDTRELRGIVTARGRDRFGCRLHRDDQPIHGAQPVAVTQYRAARQEQREFRARCRRRAQPAPLAQFERQHQLLAGGQ